MKISVKVIPNAKQNEIVSDSFDENNIRTLKIKVNQVPEDGKANKAVIEMIAKYFKIKKKFYHNSFRRKFTQ